MDKEDLGMLNQEPTKRCRYYAETILAAAGLAQNLLEKSAKRLQRFRCTSLPDVI
jgi:hypothetical protein